MKKGFPISRNVRAQWILEHIDTLINVQCPNFKNKEIPELEIVSVLPKCKPESWSAETCYQFLYRVTSTTSIIFLAHKYRMVFNLDLSPSLATVVSTVYEFKSLIIDIRNKSLKVYKSAIHQRFLNSVNASGGDRTEEE